MKGEMEHFHKLLYEVVHKGIVPRGERRHEATFRDMGIANALDLEEPIDWPALMIKHMTRVIDPTPGKHQLAYENLLTIVFWAFNVPLGEGRKLTKKDMIDRNTLIECDCLFSATEPPRQTIPRVAGPVSQLMADLRTEQEMNALLQE